MTRVLYQEKMNGIYGRVFRMGLTAKGALEKALHSFSFSDAALARQVVDEDGDINRQQEEIDSAILTFIATERPVAHDLCGMFASAKIIVEIERLADHAVHVAKAVLSVARRPPDDVLDILGRMGTLGAGMLDDAMSAFSAWDTDRAKEVASRDDRVDELHREAVRVLLSGKDTLSVEETMRLLFAARYLERVGDHVTNICEWILYGADPEAAHLNPKSPEESHRP